MEGFWGSGHYRHCWWGKSSMELCDIFFLFILYILMEFCGPDLVSDSELSESAEVQRGG